MSSQGTPGIGKHIVQTIKQNVKGQIQDIKEDLSEVHIPLVEGIKAGKAEYQESGSVGSAIIEGAKAADHQAVQNLKAIGHAATEGGIFDKDN